MSWNGHWFIELLPSAIPFKLLQMPQPKLDYLHRLCHTLLRKKAMHALDSLIKEVSTDCGLKPHPMVGKGNATEHEVVGIPSERRNSTKTSRRANRAAYATTANVRAQSQSD